jgi:uncharacterized protein (DUF2062 family)
MKAWALQFRTSIEELTAEEIAELLVIGIALGVFPIMGIPTILCLIAGFKLRLNIAVLQLINNITSPLQLALLVPFERVGAWVCGGSGQATSSLAGKLSVAALHTVAGWMCICLPLMWLTCAGLHLGLRSGRRVQHACFENPA